MCVLDDVCATMHAVTGGKPGAPMVLFVHGTPGSWHAFEEYLNHPLLLGSVDVARQMA